jgi:putative transposon-encoded protein
MYNENHVDRSPKLKRRSTRHVSEVTAIASEYGNSAKIIVPRSWLGKRVVVFLHSDYIAKHPPERTADE